MTYKNWIYQKYKPGTAKRYLREVEKFNATYPDNPGRTEVLTYLDQQRKSGKHIGTLRTTLAALKAWYDYQLQSEARADHPCKYLKLRDPQTRQIQFQDLFSPDELESLLNYKSRYHLLTGRNRVILSLLIYQALTNGELCSLIPGDFDLIKATLAVPAHGKSQSRNLSLNPNQILMIYDYLKSDRLQLLADKKDMGLVPSIPEGKLLITKKGTAESGEGISYLVETLQNRFPHRKLTPQTIRQSVVTNWLNSGIDLRKVQYMAGHKYPSSTERYRQTDVEALKDWIDKFHPLEVSE